MTGLVNTIAIGNARILRNDPGGRIFLIYFHDKISRRHRFLPLGWPRLAGHVVGKLPRLQEKPLRMQQERVSYT